MSGSGRCTRLKSYPPTSPVLRLDLTNETAEASGPRETVVLLEVPADWRTRESFSGSWSQPPEAPTLMLVASSYDDGRRTGEYAAERTEEGISVNLHRNWADNNVELSFVMEAGAGAGRWGHSTFAGHREKGPVEVSLTGE